MCVCSKSQILRVKNVTKVKSHASQSYQAGNTGERVDGAAVGFRGQEFSRCVCVRVGFSVRITTTGRSIDLFHRLCLCFLAINRAEHVCATVIIKHNYMRMCNHKIVINIILCLLNSTGHI